MTINNVAIDPAYRSLLAGCSNHTDIFNVILGRLDVLEERISSLEPDWIQCGRCGEHWRDDHVSCGACGKTL